VLAAGYFALTAFGWANGQPSSRSSSNELLNLPHRYDVGWYLSIARNGYRWNPADTGQQSVAFFPGFPMAVRATHVITRLPDLAAAMVVALGAALGAFTYLYRLARQDLDDESATAAVLLLATYPFALFFSTAYSESLFLLATLGAWLHLRRDDLLRSAGWGLLAGLTRPNGSVLSLPLSIIALQSVLADRRKDGQMPPLRVASRFAAAAMPFVGMVIHSFYVYTLTGHPLTWWTAQQAWGRQYTPLSQVIAEWWRTPLFFTSDVGATAMVDYATGWIVIVLLCLTVPVYRRLGLAYAVLIVVWLVPPLLAGGVLSLGRLTSVVFPVFIWLGATVPASHRVVWAIAFAIGQTLMAAMFFTWRPVF
jgi:hypothetical protein